MQKNVKKNSKTSVRALAALTLCVLLLLSAAFIYFGVNGAALDREGLKKLMPWIPTVLQDKVEWKKALVPDIDYAAHDVYALSIAPADEVGGVEKNASVAKVLSKRIADMGLALFLTEQEGKYALLAQKGAVSKAQLDLLTQKGEVNLLDAQGVSFLSGKYIESASFGASDQRGTSWSVIFSLNEEGKKIYAEKHSSLAGKQISLQIDGKIISSKVLEAQVAPDSLIVMPNLTQQLAFESAMLMRSGALPFEALASEAKEESALFGEKALDRTLLLLTVFVAAVALILIGTFRLSGVIATWTLLLSIGFNWFLAAVMKLNFSLYILLTVTGLTMLCMYVVISLFAGMGEDLRYGRSVKTALKASYKKAGSVGTGIHAALILLSLLAVLVDNHGLNGQVLLFVAVGTICSLLFVQVLLRALMYNSINLFGDKTVLFAHVKEAK